MLTGARGGVHQIDNGQIVRKGAGSHLNKDSL
jgi:hypothetical protein